MSHTTYPEQPDQKFFDGAAALCLINPEGKILWLNSAARKLSGRKDRLEGKNEAAVFGEPSAAVIVSGRREVRSFLKDSPLGKKLSASALALPNKEDRVETILLFLREKNEEDEEEEEEKLLLTYEGMNMAQVISMAMKLSRIDSPVLISGESGTGKVMLARYIHRNSDRGNGVFADINCAAMPGELLEEELFGRAAENGETEKEGLLSKVAGGTLFLDEINAMSPYIQTRLFYTLNDRMYRPVGGRETLPLACRVIASTDRDLQKMIAAGEFREDLFYMIAVFEIFLPPLRERVSDMRPLLNHLTDHFNRRYGLNRQISSAALSVLARYPWPGNLREMSNTVERLIVMAPEDRIEVFHLPDVIRFQTISEPLSEKGRRSFDDIVAEFESSLIRRSYAEFGSSYEVAKSLKISQSKASRLIRKYCPTHRTRKPSK